MTPRPRGRRARERLSLDYLLAELAAPWVDRAWWAWRSRSRARRVARSRDGGGRHGACRTDAKPYRPVGTPRSQRCCHIGHSPVPRRCWATKDSRSWCHHRRIDQSSMSSIETFSLRTLGMRFTHHIIKYTDASYLIWNASHTSVHGFLLNVGGSPATGLCRLTWVLRRL